MVFAIYAEVSYNSRYMQSFILLCCRFWESGPKLVLWEVLGLARIADRCFSRWSQGRIELLVVAI